MLLEAKPLFRILIPSLSPETLSAVIVTSCSALLELDITLIPIPSVGSTRFLLMLLIFPVTLITISPKGSLPSAGVLLTLIPEISPFNSI